MFFFKIIYAVYVQRVYLMGGIVIAPFHNYHNQGLYFTLTPESVTQSYFNGKKQEIALFFHMSRTN